MQVRGISGFGREPRRIEIVRRCVTIEHMPLRALPLVRGGPLNASPSHGENRGSSPLGSANQINCLAWSHGASVPGVSRRHFVLRSFTCEIIFLWSVRFGPPRTAIDLCITRELRTWFHSLLRPHRHKAGRLGNEVMSAFGGKRTCLFALHMSAFDPKRTWGLPLLNLV
jgi:hypothetical protein